MLGTAYSVTQHHVPEDVTL